LDPLDEIMKSLEDFYGKAKEVAEKCNAGKALQQIIGSSINPEELKIIEGKLNKIIDIEHHIGHEIGSIAIIALDEKMKLKALS